MSNKHENHRPQKILELSTCISLIVGFGQWLLPDPLKIYPQGGIYSYVLLALLAGIITYIIGVIWDAFRSKPQPIIHTPPVMNIGTYTPPSPPVKRYLGKKDIKRAINLNISHLVSTGGDVLELATMDVTEEFSSSKPWLWVSSTDVTIRALFTYRYHIRLFNGGNWKVRQDGNRFLVIAPPVRASLPPALHTNRMQKEVSLGFLCFSADDQIDELIEEMTPITMEIAESDEYLGAVIETCRESVSGFVYNWILQMYDQSDIHLPSIAVVFENELTDDQRYKLLDGRWASPYLLESSRKRN